MRSDIKIEVDARRTPQDYIECDITCNGQRATVIFTGSEVITEVPEAPEESAEA